MADDGGMGIGLAFFRTVENGDGDTRKEGVDGERRPRVMTLRLAENKLESRVSRYIVHRG